MYTVRTDHQIVPFGADLMRLYDRDGAVVVTAERTSGTWTIHADTVDDVTADDRGAAVTAMTEQALAVLPGDGYSTFVPQGLLEQP